MLLLTFDMDDDVDDDIAVVVVIIVSNNSFESIFNAQCSAK